MNKEHEAWIVAQLARVDALEADNERLRGALDDAAKRAHYWKAEHLAGNAEIERLLEAIEQDRKAMRALNFDTDRVLAENERLRNLNKALLAVARKYAPTEHTAFCSAVYDVTACCDCGYAAAHATIAAADQPSVRVEE